MAHVSKESVEATVTRIVVDTLGLDESQITKDSHLVDDLGADSLDSVEIVLELEQEYNLAISDEDSEKLTTFGKLVDYIHKRVNE